MAHIRQSRSDSGRGFGAKPLQLFTLFPLRSKVKVDGDAPDRLGDLNLYNERYTDSYGDYTRCRGTIHILLDEGECIILVLPDLTYLTEFIPLSTLEI